jgi:hypothetical protein
MMEDLGVKLGNLFLCDVRKQNENIFFFSVVQA